MPKFLTSVDLNQNQLLQARVENLAAAPTSPAPVKGQMYFNTTSNRLFTYNGTVWVGADAADAAIADGSIANAKLANMAVNTIKGRITAGTGVPEDLSAANVKTILALTKSDVGLSNLTNDAQVKKAASSTNGGIPKWSGADGNAIVDGYTVETTLTGGSGALPRADAVKNYVDGLLSSQDAMVFKGTIGTGGTITTLPTTYSAGWTYRVKTAGTYAAQSCEVGDMIMAVVDRAGSGNTDADWTVIQANVDGAVVGPSGSVTRYYIPQWDDTAGRLLRAGIRLQLDEFTSEAAAVPAASILFDYLKNNYGRKFKADVTANATQTFTHNFNTRDVVVSIHRIGGTFEQVMADIEHTDVNYITVKFATAPTASEYRVTIMG